MPADFRIVRVQESQSIDAAGKVQTTTRVTWRTADDGPFVEDFPAATFNTDFAREQIQRKANELARLRGAV